MSYPLTNKFWQLQQFWTSAWKRGLVRTLRIATYELWYEHKFGVHTASVIPAEDLDFDLEARCHSRDYFPSSYLLMQEALSRVADDWRDHTFVDFGCGLGRALLFASTLPFRAIIGVELSPTLAAAARRNLQHYYTTTKKLHPTWSVETADARDFDIPTDASVFYFFNPFDAVVLSAVVDRIEASIRAAPRNCLVIYAKPLHDEVFISRNFTRLPSSTADYTLFSISVTRGFQSARD